MWRIPFQQLEEGYELAEDLYTPAGQFLFPAHTELGSKEIDTLSRFKIKKFPIIKSDEFWLPEKRLDQVNKNYEILETKTFTCVKSSEEGKITPESNPDKVTQSVIEARVPKKLSKTIDLLREHFASNADDDVDERLKELFQKSQKLEDTVQHLLTLTKEISNGKLRDQLILRLKGAIDEIQARPQDSTADIWNDIQENLQNRETLRSDVIDFVEDNKAKLEDINDDILNEIENQTGPGQISLDEPESDKPRKQVVEISDEIEDISQAGEDLTGIKQQVDQLKKSLPEDDKTMSLLSQLRTLIEQLDQQQEELPAELKGKITQVLGELKEEPVAPPTGLKSGLLKNLKKLGKQEWETGLSGLKEILAKLNDESTADRLISPLEKLIVAIQSEKDELKKRIKEKVNNQGDRKKVLQLLENKSPPTVQKLHRLNVPPELLPYFEDYYKLKNKRLSEMWKELYKLVSSLAAHFKSQFAEQLKTIINEFVNQSGTNQELKKIRKTEGQVGEDHLEEIMKEAVTGKDYERLATESALPESVVKSFIELYQAPETPNKWSQELLPIFKKIIFSIFLLATPKLELTEQYVKKMMDAFQAEVPLRKLLLTPPDPRSYLLTHAFNTSVIALLLGNREFGLAEDQLQLLALGCSCAELGLTFVPESLFLNDDKLSLRGQRELSKHPIYSEKIAGRALGSVHPAVILAGQHHEYYDGSGYPRGLEHESQHRLVPPLRCGDSYAAKLEVRPYRQPFTPDRALEKMEEEKEKYDPRSLEGLRKHVGFFPQRTPVLLTDNRLAIVKQQSPENPRSPEVWIVTDSDHNRLDNVKTCNLAEQESLRVRKIVKK